METGKLIYVESVLSDEEYKECSKVYPSTYPNGPIKPPYANTEFKWRYKMGGGYTDAEIQSINKRLDQLLTKVNK